MSQIPTPPANLANGNLFIQGEATQSLLPAISNPANKNQPLMQVFAGFAKSGYGIATIGILGAAVLYLLFKDSISLSSIKSLFSSSKKKKQKKKQISKKRKTVEEEEESESEEETKQDPEEEDDVEDDEVVEPPKKQQKKTQKQKQTVVLGTQQPDPAAAKQAAVGKMVNEALFNAASKRKGG
jgi:hypothetical protein